MSSKKKSKSRFTFKRKITLSFVVVILIAGGLILWNVPLKGPNLPEPPLKDLAAGHNIKLGSRVVSERVDDRIYSELLIDQFDYFGIFAETHYDDLHPSPDEYDFAELDKLVDFSKDNKKPVQMFHLLWGEGNHLPDWLKNGDYSKEQISEFNRDHIAKVAGHYKGSAESWSVVNEAFTRNQHVYGLRDWFSDNLGGGTQYIDDAFISARQADPNAKLLLNDFNNEGENKISDAMYNYIKDAKARGIPIDGLGMQMHIDGNNPPKKDDVIKNIQRFGAIGVPTYVTEFDVNLNRVEGSDEYKSKLEAQITYDMARACIESKSCVSFTEFGTTDRDKFIKWLTKDDSHAYLFDKKYQPKPSYDAFRQAWSEN
jgi:endo-1,4-beta-xylanase